MPILTATPITTPHIPTTEQIVEQISKRIVNMTKQTFDELVRTQRIGIQMVWENSKASPQEIIDGLGEDAIKIFQFHGALSDFIVAVAQTEGFTPQLKTPTNAFTVDADSGTITVTDQPYVAP